MTATATVAMTATATRTRVRAIPPRPLYGACTPEEKARLWSMTVEERIDAMYRGQLSYRELCHWGSRCPDEIPKLNGDWWFLTAFTPEVADADEA